MLNEAGRYDLDSDTATIRCLPHVIHITITAFLVVLKAVKKADMRDDDLDTEELTEQMAEEIGAELFEGVAADDDEILREQAHEGEEIDGSIFAKVSGHLSQLCHRASLTLRHHTA